MSENSGPLGQSKSPTKPKTPTPTPSPTHWDPWQGARNEATPVPYTVPPISVWTTGGNVTTGSVRDREGHMGVYNTSRFTWHPNQDGTIDSTDAMKQNTVVSASAILGDYGNRKNPWLTNSDTLYDIPGAVAAWVNQNNGKDSIGQARARLISLGRITGEDAKITGNGIDPALLNALNGAVYDITITNYNKLAIGEDLLTLDEGLLSLAPAPATTTSSGSGSGGTYIDTNRQIFNAGDYRISVDQAYKDITGQAADEDTLDQFVAVLQRMDDKNPQKTVTKVSGGGKIRSSVTSGGVSQAEAEDVLKQDALNAPGTEQYQKATSFMDMFNKAIQAKVQL
jgi:hypothetical protein